MFEDCQKCRQRCLCQKYEFVSISPYCQSMNVDFAQLSVKNKWMLSSWIMVFPPLKVAIVYKNHTAVAIIKQTTFIQKHGLCFLWPLFLDSIVPFQKKNTLSLKMINEIKAQRCWCLNKCYQNLIIIILLTIVDYYQFIWAA